MSGRPPFFWYDNDSGHQGPFRITLDYVYQHFSPENDLEMKLTWIPSTCKALVTQNIDEKQEVRFTSSSCVSAMSGMYKIVPVSTSYLSFTEVPS